MFNKTWDDLYDRGTTRIHLKSASQEYSIHRIQTSSWSADTGFHRHRFSWNSITLLLLYKY